MIISDRLEFYTDFFECTGPQSGACIVEIWITWCPLFIKRPSFTILLFLLFFTILTHPPDWRYKMLAFVPVHHHLPGFLWSLNQKGIVEMQLVFFHRNHLLDKLASFVVVLMGTQWEVTFPIREEYKMSALQQHKLFVFYLKWEAATDRLPLMIE